MTTRRLLTVLIAAAVAALAWLALNRDPAEAAPRAAVDGAGTTDLGVTVAELREQLSALQQALAAGTTVPLANLPVPQQGELCGQKMPLERPEVREALAYELTLTVGKPLMPLMWLRRAPVAMPAIEQELRAAGLPDDLKYVAMIESDLRVTARSPANAAGLWQFMDSTGRNAGLRIDKYVDERLDPDSATRAAARYLGSLRRQFGDWFLALAAYNAGESTVDKALKEQGHKDYFDLYLPYETRRYVLRAMAAKLVYEKPEAYGLTRISPYYLPEYRSIDITVKTREADLRSIAGQYGYDYALLRLSNPQLRGPVLGMGKYRLRLPVKAPALAEAGS